MPTLAHAYEASKFALEDLHSTKAALQTDLAAVRRVVREQVRSEGSWSGRLRAESADSGSGILDASESSSPTRAARASSNVSDGFDILGRSPVSASSAADRLQQDLE